MSSTHYRTWSHAHQVPDSHSIPISRAARLPHTNSALEATLIGANRTISEPADPAPKKMSTIRIPEDGEGVSQDKNRKPKVTFDLHTESDLLTNEGSNESGDDQSREWTTVQRKRSWSSPSHNEQANLVKLAEKELMKKDCQILEARKHNLNLTRERLMSREEGPSKNKGKAPDPRNWGDAGVEDDEIDLDTQRAALESFRLA
ncbi:hypothetical protein BD769DRAFT_1390686 [Suillus cothurnatus]|nr:hypothetical protein BD769DRAFT_1390686 [Suillus cothurnatus]